MLKNCEKLSVVALEPIEVELILIDPTELSTDQNYLINKCYKISKGSVFVSV